MGAKIADKNNVPSISRLEDSSSLHSQPSTGLPPRITPFAKRIFSPYSSWSKHHSPHAPSNNPQHTPNDKAVPSSPSKHENDSAEFDVQSACLSPLLSGHLAHSQQLPLNMHLDDCDPQSPCPSPGLTSDSSSYSQRSEHLSTPPPISTSSRPRSMPQTFHQKAHDLSTDDDRSQSSPMLPRALCSSLPSPSGTHDDDYAWKCATSTNTIEMLSNRLARSTSNQPTAIRPVMQSPRSSSSSSVSFPVPEPPVVLPSTTRDSDLESASLRGACDSFLSHAPPPEDSWIQVETLSSEYKLTIRLPGFRRDGITLSTRRKRVLHIVADSWGPTGGHFERRISFGYDADLTLVRAEFDGELLKVVIPRRNLPF